jgi:tetratricopeptide (TPR) repeat protein
VKTRAFGLVAVAVLTGACASALREPPPVATIGQPPPTVATAPEVDRLLADAEAAIARRPDAAEVGRARELFLGAAQADEARTEGLLGAMRAIAWLVEHERDGASREGLATEAVQLGQWCERRAPDTPECAYRLALAVGQQARERPATAHDGLKVMIDLLERVAGTAPDLDAAGPDRVLALVRLRAPGWPAGPGDPEAALDGARRAAARAEAYPPNQMVLGEALAANGHPDEARATYERALALAEACLAAGDPDAAGWRREIASALDTLR